MAKQSPKRPTIKAKKKKAPARKSCSKTCDKNKAKVCQVVQPEIPPVALEPKVSLVAKVLNKIKNIFRLG